MSDEALFNKGMPIRREELGPAPVRMPTAHVVDHRDSPALPLPPRRPPTSRPTGRRLAGTSPQAWDRLTLIIWPSTAHGKRRNAAFPNHAQSTGTMIRNLSSTILHCGAPAPGQPKRSR